MSIIASDASGPPLLGRRWPGGCRAPELQIPSVLSRRGTVLCVPAISGRFILTGRRSRTHSTAGAGAVALNRARARAGGAYGSGLPSDRPHDRRRAARRRRATGSSMGWRPPVTSTLPACASAPGSWPRRMPRGRPVAVVSGRAARAASRRWRGRPRIGRRVGELGPRAMHDGVGRENRDTHSPRSPTAPDRHLLDFLPTAKAGGFQRSPAGVPVSQPVAGGVSRAVLHQLRRHRRGYPRLRQDLPQECSSPR